MIAHFGRSRFGWSYGLNTDHRRADCILRRWLVFRLPNCLRRRCSRWNACATSYSSRLRFVLVRGANMTCRHWTNQLPINAPTPSVTNHFRKTGARSIETRSSQRRRVRGDGTESLRTLRSSASSAFTTFRRFQRCAVDAHDLQCISVQR